MSDQADLDELAQRYLDLWQDQMSAVASDGDFAAALQRIVTTFGLAASSMPAAWPTAMAGPAAAGKTESTRNGEDAEGAGRADAAAGTATPAAASDGGGVDLDELARRLAALEERVAALEQRPAGRRRSAAKSTRARRS